MKVKGKFQKMFYERFWSNSMVFKNKIFSEIFYFIIIKFKFMKIKFIFFLVIFIFFPFISRANVFINEIMYDAEGSDTGREWVEIYNSHSEAIDLSSWKFFEAETNHALTPFSGGAVIPTQGFAIIANDPNKFLIDWPNFAGIIFDSSFSLNNEPGESLALKNGNGEVIDEVTYATSLGAGGDGQSLQKINGAWVVANPTVGAVNSVTTANENNSNTNTSGGETVSETNVIAPKKVDEANPSFSAEIISKKIVIAGVETFFESKILGLNNEILTRGKLFWNFGDGFTVEEKEVKNIAHTYQYPGDYLVILDYSQNPYSPKTDASDRFILKVISPEVIISNTGGEKDFFVELTNSSKYEIDLSHWILKSNQNTFVFPNNTVILAGRKLILSSEITKLVLADRDSLQLYFPSGKEVNNQSSDKTSQKVEISEIKIVEKSKEVNSISESKVQEFVKIEESSNPVFSESAIGVEGGVLEESLDQQMASVADATNSFNFKKSIYFYFLVILLFIVLGSGLVIYLRRKNGEEIKGVDDFSDIEILDDE